MSRELKFRAWDKKHLRYTKVLKIYKAKIIGSIHENPELLGGKE